MKEFVKLDRIGGINGSGIYFYSMRQAERNYFFIDEISDFGRFLCDTGYKRYFRWSVSKKKEIDERLAMRGKYKWGKVRSYYDLFFIEWSDKKMFLKVADKCILDYFMGAEKTQYDVRSHFYISKGEDEKNQELFVTKPPVPFIEITSGEVTAIGFENYPSRDGRSERTSSYTSPKSFTGQLHKKS